MAESGSMLGDVKDMGTLALIGGVAYLAYLNREAIGRFFQGLTDVSKTIQSVNDLPKNTLSEISRVCTPPPVPRTMEDDEKFVNKTGANKTITDVITDFNKRTTSGEIKPVWQDFTLSSGQKISTTIMGKLGSDRLPSGRLIGGATVAAVPVVQPVDTWTSISGALTGKNESAAPLAPPVAGSPEATGIFTPEADMYRQYAGNIGGVDVFSNISKLLPGDNSTAVGPNGAHLSGNTDTIMNYLGAGSVTPATPVNYQTLVQFGNTQLGSTVNATPDGIDRINALTYKAAPNTSGISSTGQHFTTDAQGNVSFTNDLTGGESNYHGYAYALDAITTKEQYATLIGTTIYDNDLDQKWTQFLADMSRMRRERRLAGY